MKSLVSSILDLFLDFEHERRYRKEKELECYEYGGRRKTEGEDIKTFWSKSRPELAKQR